MVDHAVVDANALVGVPARTMRSWLAATVALMLFAWAIIATGAERTEFRSEKASFRLVKLVQGLQHPWSIAWLPDGRMLVTERPGRLRLVSKDFQLDPKAVDGVPRVVTGGQSGLFDVVLHPRYAKNGWLYLAYMAPGEGGSGIEVLRAKLEDHRLVDQQVIFRAVPKLNGSLNLGGRLIFDRQGYLYVSVGDRFEQNRAQRLDDDSGKLIRLQDDGRVPANNPFVTREGARPEICTLGNRNIEGMALHPRTGELWTHEHGPQGGDEINIIRAGRNYGWPVITYGVNYGTGTKIGEGTHKAGMEQPLYKWVPSIAPSGMAFYEGDKFPAWRGMLFIGALKAEMLVRLELEGEEVTHEERLIKNAIGRVRDVRVGRDGYIYLLTDERNGVLARLEP
jgi:aldose sugar dehydrogenase